MNKQRLINCAIDCITKFRAGRYPLKNVANDIIKARKLNSSLRKAFADLVFRWSRESFLTERFIKEKIRFSASLSSQQRDTLALDLIFDHDEAYEQWIKSIGQERYLLALGPLIADALKTYYQDAALAIAQGCFLKPAKYLAVDRRQVSVDEVLKALKALDLEYFCHPILPLAIGIRKDFNMSVLPSALSQHLWLMDAGSQIIAELIDPKPDDRVLDLCAGEGNKAHYITMKDCHYVAVDVDKSRLDKAKQRLSHRKIEFLVSDARNLSESDDSFDWVLLDAPCSGTGVLRRHPDLIHRLTKNHLIKYEKLQNELLNSAIKLLKPGGKLIYATCSLLPSENEQQIRRILKENSKIKPLSLAHLEGEHLEFLDEALSNNSLTLFPHIHDCDGFYFAALTKMAS